MKVVLIAATLLVAVSGAKLGQNVIEEEKPTPKPIPYNFGFRVQDDETTNYQNRAEVADEGGVRGSYSYVMPDGFVYTITYEDKLDGNGNQVTIRKEPSGIDVVSPKYEPEAKLTVV